MGELSKVKEPSEAGRMVLPWMVLPSQAAVCVGIAPSGAEHSRTKMALLLLLSPSVEENVSLAGMTTLMFCPLANGIPDVKPACGCAALLTVDPLVGTCALATATRPRV